MTGNTQSNKRSIPGAHFSAVFFFAASVSVWGCAQSGTYREPDASVDQDAAASDSGLDASSSDALTQDAALVDAMPTDGMPVPDGGCPGNLSDCSGQCFDLETTHEHCGSCDHACGPSETCVNGNCELHCQQGWIVCHGTCVDPLDDLDNCNGCDQACTAGLHATPVCRQGICDVDCDPGWSDMNGDGSCETNCVPANPPTETCNGQDDDCDGSTDEDFSCVLGESVACTTTCGSSGTGTCASGCSLPGPSQCVPPPETCNGRDDDCDGACDDGFECCAGSESSCTTSCGSSGTRVCSASCTWGQCRPPAEACNGQDDDCDGLTDEDFWVYQCPLDSQTNPNQSACNAACSATANCVLRQVSASDDITLRECNWNDECSPNYLISLIKGIGNRIEFYRASGTIMGGDSLIGSIILSGATASGEVRLRNCDSTDCYPDYRISLIQGNGNDIEFYRDGGLNGDVLVGSVSIAGATASGNIRYRTCDMDGCSPDYLVSRVKGNGNHIEFYRTSGINGHTIVGRITLTATDYECPLDGSLTCSGNPPACTQTATCSRVVSCQ